MLILGNDTNLPRNSLKAGKKYKRIVRTLGSIYEVSKSEAKDEFEQAQSKYQKGKYGQYPYSLNLARGI